jgi:hypothetical protein
LFSLSFAPFCGHRVAAIRVGVHVVVELNVRDRGEGADSNVGQRMAKVVLEVPGNMPVGGEGREVLSE